MVVAMPTLAFYNHFLTKVQTLTIGTSIRTIFLNLWDENLDRLISFREFYRRYDASGAAL